MNKIPFKCTQCGEEGTKKPAEYRKHKKHFCSRKCYDDWKKDNQKERDVLICSNCGKRFERLPSAPKRPLKFCSRKCQYAYFRGKNSPTYKKGRYKNERGYVLILSPYHPRPVAKCYAYEHTLVMEKELGRFMTQGEIVHHKNGNKADNRIENLLLLKSQLEHRNEHARRYSFNGKLLTITDWAKKIGIKRKTLNDRIQRWGIARALTTPLNKS